MLSLPHPFLDHPETINIPEDLKPLVEELYKWIQSNPRFPNYSRNQAYLFLHACYYDIASAKKALLRYIQIRAAAPDLFNNRDIMLDEIQFVFDMTHMVALPHKTPEGYNILVYRLSDSDPSKMHFGNAIKAFCMFNDVRISEDGVTEGYVVVFDMKGLRFGHLARVQLGPLRTFMAYIQEAHPVRLKRIYVVHTSFFINQIMTLVKPLIKSDLLSLLKFTSSGPSDVLPVELLPVDYGGPLERLEKLYKQQRRIIETRYHDWLIDSNNLREIPKDEQIKVVNNNTDDIKSTSLLTSSSKSSSSPVDENNVNNKVNCKFNELQID